MEEIPEDREPERLTEGVQAEEGRDDCAGLEAFYALWTPIDVGQAQPEGELVKRQTEGDPEDDSHAEMPELCARGERDKAGEHQEQDAPKQMVDVQAACRDQIAKRPMREQFVMDDRRDGAQHSEREQEGDQDAEGDPPSEVEPAVVMPDA